MKIPEVILVQSAHRPGSLASILHIIAEEHILVEGLNAVRRTHRWTTWEITLEPDEGKALHDMIKKLDALPNAKVIGRSDRVFDRHLGGKLEVKSRIPINSIEILRDVYTPGVARVCLAIEKDPEKAALYTSRQKTVAIVTNGTAILGLGHIGAVAGLPVIEGKAALLNEVAGLSGVPILIESEDSDTIVNAIIAIAPTFGAIQLEDIRSPECFEIEARLREALDIPVMHDDQHGTAVVTLAALLNATERAGLAIKGSTVAQIGLGAAGLGICRLLTHYGIRKVMGTDLDPSALKRLEEIGGIPATLAEVMAQADVIVATTGVRGLIKPEMVRKGQVILALSNPEPEIEPDIAMKHGASYAADGKVVNNLLGFPGIFRGALEANAKSITDKMLIAAAEALAAAADQDALVPHPLDSDVHEKVAQAVRDAAKI